MNKQRLILINSCGDVFSLNTERKYFKELVKTTGTIKLKRVSAVDTGCWGIGQDHQVYIFIYNTDVPIRVAETTYENQRWSPWRSFSQNNLLPSDRRNWSNEQGDRYITQSDFPLPSQYWEWEGDWLVDENFKGEITDRGGWQYASDFPRQYSPEPKTLSMVRRRKWLRFRRYTAFGKWAKINIEDIDDDNFIDVAVGGFELPGQPSGFLAVWALTINGKVYVRNNVNRQCPEGSRWILVSTDKVGVINISVGPTGLVWAVTWDGLIMVRLGINRDSVFGTSWCHIPYPTGNTRMMQVAVGRNSVWALSREGKIWFRQGIDGDKAWFNQESAVGSCWVEMVGLLSHITLTPNNQVFGIGLNDRKFYFRTGVSSSDLGGKTWQMLSLQEDLHMLRQASSTYPSLEDDDYSTDSNYQSSSAVSLRSTPVSMISIPEHSQINTHNVQSLPVSAIKQAINHLSLSLHNQHDNDTQSNINKNTNTEPNINKNTKSENEHINKAVIQTDNIITNQTDTPDCADIKTNGDCVSDCDIKNSAKLPNSNSDNFKTSDCDNVTNSDCDNVIESNGITTKTKNSVTNSKCDSVIISNDNDKTKTDNIVKSTKCDNSKIQNPKSNVVSNVSDTVYRQDSIESPEPDKMFNFVTDIDEDDIKGNDNKKVKIQEIDVGAKIVEESNNLKQTSMICMTSAVSCVAGSDSRSVSSEVSVFDDSDSTPVIEKQVLDMYTMTPAMPRYFWVWFSAMGCNIDDPSAVKWLQTRKDSESSMEGSNVRRALLPSLRLQILDKLCERNKQEIQQFQYIEQAFEKTSWLKKSAMKWYRYGNKARFEDVTVELEQGLKEDEDSGAVTVHFYPRGKPVIMQIKLNDIVCVKKVADPTLQSVFQIHTANSTVINQPYLLMTLSENDCNEWLTTLLTANSKLWKIKQSVETGSIWSTTLRGDVFIHQPLKIYSKSSEMLWCQHGGHIKTIETCCNGVTWAIGYDQTAWIYNGGYGGGVFRATSAMSKDCHQQTDTRTIYTYENQKWYPVVGYTNKGFLTECYEWSDSTGIQDRTKENIKLPSSNWNWSCEWTVDFNTPGRVDQDGWQYAGNFNKPFHPQPGIRDRVRRRRWFRKCKLMTVGPWYKVGSTPIKDITMQLDPISSIHQRIIVWAIGTAGNVLCRQGVTSNCLQGESWVDIPTDLQFTSVSIGGNNRSWGIGVDGSVWYRPGVTADNPTGTCWLQVIPTPPSSILLSISVGQTSVWAVDTKGILWFREEITPTFPEGTRWSYVCNRVNRVSVGHNDQVWIVSQSNFGKNKHGGGVVYRRVGVTPDRPVGTGWDKVIGDGWQYVSIRGHITNNTNTDS